MNTKILVLAWVLSVCIYSQSASAQFIEYDPIHHQFSVGGLKDPIAAAGASKSPEWTYLWEFGDGNYREGPTEKYCYATPGLKSVRLQLVPHYSHDSTRTITKVITVTKTCANSDCDGKGACGEYDYDIKKLVTIKSNADNELVPENDVQFIVHYSLPRQAAGEGTLFLFYNGNQIIKEAKFAPLVLQRGGRDAPRLYGATRLRNPKQRLREQTVSPLPSPELGYNVEGFDCRLAAGQSGRMFLTMSASASLDTVTLKRKRDKLSTHVRAVWIPKGHPFSESQMTDRYDLKMYSVHDPNRIHILKPRNQAIYARQKPEEFTVEIEFQNLGGAPAARVVAAVPWPENIDT
ncbi:MAG: PKD domain-containing protein, partial [Bacteroidota bacterium]